MPGVGNSELFSPPWAEGVALAVSKGRAVAKGAFFAQLRTVVLNLLFLQICSRNPLFFAVSGLLYVTLQLGGFMTPSIGVWVLSEPRDFPGPPSSSFGVRDAESCK